jgi:hypothetical protein
LVFFQFAVQTRRGHDQLGWYVVAETAGQGEHVGKRLRRAAQRMDDALGL